MSLLNEARNHYRARGVFGLLDAISTKARDEVRDVVFGIDAVDDAAYARSVARLRREMASEETTDDVFETIYDSYRGVGSYRSVRPQQSRREHRRFVERIDDFGPDVVVEVGTAEGGTLYPWIRAIEPAAVVSVDVTFLNRNLEFYRAFGADRDTDVTLLRADSQRESTRDRLVEALDGREIDFLFIDADHRYEGVKRDFELYEPLVRDGGLVAFHDIAGKDAVVGVGELWEEIADEYDSETIVDEVRTSSDDGEIAGATGGVGIVRKPE